MSQEPEFKVYPLASHIRVSRDGRVESNLRIGRRSGTSEIWRPLKVMTDHRARGYPYVNVKRENGKHRPVKVHKIVGSRGLAFPLSPA